MQSPLPRLSCRRCTQRKLKCNKAIPCSSCELAGSHCEVVERARKPRGRTKRHQPKNNSLLEDRLIRVENIIKNVQSFRSAVLEGPQSSSQTLSATIQATEDFVAPEFWSALTDGVAALRETIEDSSRDEIEVIEAQEGMTIAPQMSNMSSAFDTLLLDHSTGYDHLSIQIAQTEPDRHTLFKIYRTRVDCLYKILHWPTVVEDLENASPVRTDGQINDEPLHPSLQALQYAIFFLAYGSISDQECSNLKLGERQSMLRYYQKSFEETLSKTNFLTSPTIVTLQAFVIYLVGLRVFSSCASSWTLVATAIRQAQALRLGSEDSKRYSDFDLEIRRRLLFGIGLMDAYAAMDRGTVTMMSPHLFSTFPRNINDAEMTPEFVAEENEEFYWKDTSFFIMMCESMKCHKYMDRVGDFHQPDQVYAINKQRVDSLARLFQKRYSNIPTTAGALQRFAKAGSQAMVASIQLILRRPQCPQPHHHVPDFDDFDILGEALEVLKKGNNVKIKEFTPWLWKDWVPWHALAVSLAELCTQPQHALANQAWPVLLHCFERYKKAVADGKSGMLWRPIARLMARAESVRDQNGNASLLHPTTDAMSQTLEYDPSSSTTETVPFTWSSFIEDLDYQDSSYGFLGQSDEYMT